MITTGKMGSDALKTGTRGGALRMSVKKQLHDSIVSPIRTVCMSYSGNAVPVT